jgi:mitotic spindle assembly checkpoint protein MAD2
MVKKYGLPMLITADEELKGYLETILKQVHGVSEIGEFFRRQNLELKNLFVFFAEWLMQKTITRLVLAITSKETMETVERWQFDIITEDEGDLNGAAEGGGRLPCSLILSFYLTH